MNVNELFLLENAPSLMAFRTQRVHCETLSSSKTVIFAIRVIQLSSTNEQDFSVSPSLSKRSQSSRFSFALIVSFSTVLEQ